MQVHVGVARFLLEFMAVARHWNNRFRGRDVPMSRHQPRRFGGQ